MLIFLSFDFDYIEDYEYFKDIQEVIDVPCTVFLSGSRGTKIDFKENVEIGNHSFLHQEWYGLPLENRLADLDQNHQWIKDTYGVEPKVYRSPHLRNFPDTANEMEKRGYKREMDCAECPRCYPMEHSHLKQYFSSHHYFKEHKTCPLTFLEAFEMICKQGKDFTFFLDPHAFPKDKLYLITDLIKIGKKYGTFSLLSH